MSSSCSSTSTTRCRSRAWSAATAWRSWSTAGAPSWPASPWSRSSWAPSSSSTRAAARSCGSRRPRTSASWPRRCCSDWRCATDATTSRRCWNAPRLQSGPGRRRLGSASARSGSGSPVTCTTSSPTRWWPSTCRPEWGLTCWTATPSGRAARSSTSSGSAARRWPTSGPRSAPCAPATPKCPSCPPRGGPSSRSWAPVCARPGSRSSWTSTPPRRRPRRRGRHRLPDRAGGPHQRRPARTGRARARAGLARARSCRGRGDRRRARCDPRRRPGSGRHRERPAGDAGAGPGRRRHRRCRPDRGRWLAGARHAARGDVVTIRVLVADDQTLVRAGFRALLESEDDIEVVAEAVDGHEAVELVRALRPDVALMDIRMPRLDGLAATAAITDDPALVGTRVVVLTTFELDEYVFGALRAGASGFLLKDLGPQALIDAVRVVADGQALLAPQVTRRLIEAYVDSTPATHPAPEPAADDQRLAGLTPREREILVLVGRGMSNHEIAEHLVLSPLTAKTHVSRLFTKLGVRDRAQLVVLAYETGLARQA